jgi:hypothetical protein
LETLLQEEQELLRQLAEEERLWNEEKIDLEDRSNRVKIKRKDLISSKEKLKNLEDEIAKKDSLYDKQISSGKELDNLPTRHAQKLQQLENLQNVFVELENKTDELHCKLMQKSQEVKDIINSANELANRIKLSSSLQLNEFPQLELIDLHKRNDLIKEYKVNSSFFQSDSLFLNNTHYFHAYQVQST